MTLSRKVELGDIINLQVLRLGNSLIEKLSCAFAFKIIIKKNRKIWKPKIKFQDFL